MICIGGVPVKNSFSAGPDLNCFNMIHRGGRFVCLFVRVPFYFVPQVFNANSNYRENSKEKVKIYFYSRGRRLPTALMMESIYTTSHQLGNTLDFF